MDENRAIFDHYLSWFRSKVSHSSNQILEIGVGPHGFLRYYAEIAQNYVGLDIDDYSTNYADVKNARVVIYDGENFPLENDSFDLVVSHSVFEHIANVPAVLREVYRTLRPGALAFITINPLYYSSWGSHGTLEDHVTRLQPWEHLDPASPHYLTDCPPQMNKSGYKGCYLNKLTMSELLSIVGSMPWSIVSLDRAYERFELPEFLEKSDIPISDICNHDFRIILRKDVI